MYTVCSFTNVHIVQDLCLSIQGHVAMQGLHKPADKSIEPSMYPCGTPHAGPPFKIHSKGFAVEARSYTVLQHMAPEIRVHFTAPRSFLRGRVREDKRRLKRSPC